MIILTNHSIGFSVIVDCFSARFFESFFIFKEAIMATAQHEGIIKISPQTSTAYLQVSCTEEYIALPATSNEVGLWKHGKIDKIVSCLNGFLGVLSSSCSC